MADDDIGPESVREVAAEDFLFHLYRGSELLQDDRVHEAKQELENALALQPRDAKGQDLLAIVYFRLGLYPRAIAIYSELITAYPDATTPRVNLALCFLKTGQPAAARTELERVIQRDPGHNRAWGYLGLAFQRLGDTERAVAAFQAGGHHTMARRLDVAPATGAPIASPSGRGLTTPEKEALSRAATEAFDELDRGDGGFRADSTSRARSASGTWAAMEPGRETVAGIDRRSYPSLVPSPASSDSLPPAPQTTIPARGGVTSSLPVPPVPRISDTIPPSSAHTTTGPPADARRIAPLDKPLPSPASPRSCAAPAPASVFARDNLLVFPRDHAVSLHPSGSVLVQAGAFVAVRFDVVRAMSFTTSIATRPLVKRTRGREGEEPLGSATSPLLAIEGAGQLVLGPPAGTRLVPIVLGDEMLNVRESALVGLEGDVVFEGARLPGGDGDFIAMVQLRGPGTVTLALPVNAVTLELDEAKTVLLRVHAVLGWLGRVHARALPPSESPTRARGLVAIQGEGMVLVDGR